MQKMQKIRMGMVGGGTGSFIGAVHRMAAALDGKIELVCGAFSSDPERSAETGRSLGLDENRVYASFEDMFQAENRLPENERMELVSVVTPNHVHFEPVKLALESGFHVICDKPLSFDLEQAYSLRKIVKNSGKIFALTHNYTGYPMVKQARFLVQSGALGKIKKVVAEYAQGWLTLPIEKSGQKQASWRTDPSKSGIAGALGDIGTHAENLCGYITNLSIQSVCADISSLVEDRALDDDGNILLRFENGARGILYASQISAGEENNLKIRVYGEKGSIEWAQMEPNTLIVKWLDRPVQHFRTGGVDVCEHAAVHTRLPAGHPEGYIEAFANIYRNVAMAVDSARANNAFNADLYDFPGIEEGVRGMEFVYQAVQSGKQENKWLICGTDGLFR